MTSQCISEPFVDETKFVSAAWLDVFAVINGGWNQRAVPGRQGVTMHSISYSCKGAVSIGYISHD